MSLYGDGLIETVAAGPETVIRLVKPRDVITDSTIRCPNMDPKYRPGLCFHGMSTAKVPEFEPCEDCPINFGEWGAWRAIAPLLTEMAVYYLDHPEKWDNLTHFALWYFWADAYLDAIGWYP